MVENRKEYFREYYKKNKERKKQYQEEYYQKNKEKILKYNRDYYQKNKEKRIEYHKNYYEKNKDYLRNYHNQWTKRYYKINPSKRYGDRNQLGDVKTLMIYNTKDIKKLEKLLESSKKH